MTYCRCGRPTRDAATVCDKCITDLEQALNEVPFVTEQLDITISRQRAIPAVGSSPSAERPIHWHDKAAEARRDLHNLLASWVRMCHDEGVRHNGGKGGLPIDRLPSLANWLICRLPGLRMHAAGPDAVDEITKQVAECRRIIFWKKRARIYLGTCAQPTVSEDGEREETCPGEVYADEGAAVAACDDCGQGVTVVIRKHEIDQRLADHLCTPAEIATYAVHLGLSAPRSAVRAKVNYWSRHKRIQQRGTAPNGDPLFRYGEVRALLYTHFGEKVKA